MPHSFNLDSESLNRIERLLPQLKYSVPPSKIIRWLENFEVNEVKPMLDLLGVFEYISYDELFFRLNNLLTSILEHIPEEDEMLIIPYGKIGKSSIYVTYPLSHTPIYKKRYIYKGDIKIEISNDIKNIKLNYVKTIIFIDDFIGTGNSFIDWYEHEEQSSLRFFLSSKKIYSIFLLSCIAMESAIINIEKKYLFKVVADSRHKIFEDKSSALHI